MGENLPSLLSPHLKITAMSVNMLVTLKLSNIFTRRTFMFLVGQSVSYCDKLGSHPCFYIRVNCVKSKKTVCDPRVREVIATDSRSDVTSKSNL